MNNIINVAKTVAILTIAFVVFLVLLRSYWGLTEFCCLLLAYVVMGMFKKGFFRKCKFNVTWKGFVTSICFIALANFTLILYSNFISTKDYIDYVDIPFVAIRIMFLAPIVEETLFRGIILKKLLKINIPIWLAIFISALLFGLSHVQLKLVIMTTITGVIFGIVYWRTKSLYSSIAIHMANNIIAYFIQYCSF